MNKKKKPGWVTAVAIIAIVFSGFGVMGGLQEAMSPMMFEQQKAEYELIVSEMDEVIAQAEEYGAEENQAIINFIKTFKGFLEKILNMPEWYKTWMVISGLLQLIINGFYLFAAIWMLQLKPSSPLFMMIALPPSIVLGITRVYFAHEAFATAGLWAMSASMIAIVIEFVLLLIIIKADKTPFYQFEA